MHIAAKDMGGKVLPHVAGKHMNEILKTLGKITWQYLRLN